MYQETISVDGIIDRLFIKYNNDAKKIRKVVNDVTYQKVSEKYVHERFEKYRKYKHQLEHLKTIPVIEQRSPEWYECRKSIITASDFAQALGDGKFGSQKQFYIKKCGYEEEKFNPSLPPLKWGTMFEPIASTIYSERNNMELFDFGLIKHPSIRHFGASPDGINQLGIMVEIKCPFKRKVNGCVPIQYYYQIQGQLDVCGLDECDYLECEFSCVEDLDSLMDVKKDHEYGCVVELEENGLPTYVYSDIYYSFQDGDKNKKQIETWIKNHKDYVKIHYWYLEVFHVIRVYRDQDFLNEKLQDLEVVWSKIAAYRQDKDLYLQETKTTKMSSKQEKEMKNPMSIKGYSFIE